MDGQKFEQCCAIKFYVILGESDKKEFFFLTGSQDSHLQTVTIPEAAYIQLRRRPPEG